MAVCAVRGDAAAGAAGGVSLKREIETERGGRARGWESFDSNFGESIFEARTSFVFLTLRNLGSRTRPPSSESFLLSPFLVSQAHCTAICLSIMSDHS